MTPGRSGEQAQFAASLHDMLADADVPAAARPGPPGTGLRGWPCGAPLAGLGVTALAVPERDGGLGASFADVVVACEELGHHAVPGPVAESVAAVPVLLAALPRDATVQPRPTGTWQPENWPAGAGPRRGSPGWPPGN